MPKRPRSRRLRAENRSRRALRPLPESEVNAGVQHEPNTVGHIPIHPTQGFQIKGLAEPRVKAEVHEPERMFFSPVPLQYYAPLDGARELYGIENNHLHRTRTAQVGRYEVMLAPKRKSMASREIEINNQLELEGGVSLPRDFNDLADDLHGEKTDNWQIGIRLLDRDVADGLRMYRGEEIASWINEAAAKLSPSLEPSVVSVEQRRSGNFILNILDHRGLVHLATHSHGWIDHFGAEAEIHLPTYRVIVDGIPQSSVDGVLRSTLIRTLKSQNPAVFKRAIIINAQAILSDKPGRKLYVGLAIDFLQASPANKVARRGIEWAGKHRSARLTSPAAKFQQCELCWRYDHHEVECDNLVSCCNCAETHDTVLCPYRPARPGQTNWCCTNCGGRHTACSTACGDHRMVVQRMKAARRVNIERHDPRYRPMGFIKMIR